LNGRVRIMIVLNSLVDGMKDERTRLGCMKGMNEKWKRME